MQAKEMQSGEQSEMIRSLNKLVKCVGVAIIPIGLVLFSQAFFIQHDGFRESVTSMIAAVIGMIPEVFTCCQCRSCSQFCPACAEESSPARYEVYRDACAGGCALRDKTGTITENTMKVQDVVETDDTMQKRWSLCGQ